MGVFFQANAIVDPPILKCVGPVSDQVARLHPIITQALDERHRHGMQRGKGTELNEIGCGTFQFYDQRAVVHRACPNLREVRDFSIRKGLSVFDGKELVVVLRSGLWSQRTLPAGHKIPRCQRTAITPFRIRSQVECVGLAIRRNLPTLCDARHSLSILVIGTEPFKEGIDDTALRLACDDCWIKRLRFCPIHENQVRAPAVVIATREGETKNCHANPVTGA